MSIPGDRLGKYRTAGKTAFAMILQKLNVDKKII